MNKTLVIACAAAAAVIVGGGVGAWALLSGSPASSESSPQSAPAAAAEVDPQLPRPVPVVKKLDIKAVEWDPKTKADLAAQGFTFDEVGRPVAPGSNQQRPVSEQASPQR